MMTGGVFAVKVAGMMPEIKPMIRRNNVKKGNAVQFSILNTDIGNETIFDAQGERNSLSSRAIRSEKRHSIVLSNIDLVKVLALDSPIIRRIAISRDRPIEIAKVILI